MKISLTAFTDRGEALAVRITKQLNNDGEQAEFVRCGKRMLPSRSEQADFVRCGKRRAAFDGEPAGVDDRAPKPSKTDTYVRAASWTAERFHTSEALIFIGAAGIAVRSIAPHIVSKTTDPAVVVIDEAGRFVIPILSGHLRGANALASRLASITGGQAVITTATDVNGVFAFDDWARRMNCAVENTDLIREVSGALLMGESVPLHSDFEISGKVPHGVEPGGYNKASVCVTICENPRAHTGADIETGGVSPQNGQNAVRKLRVIPRIVCAGIGCRRGTDAHVIEEAVMEALGENGISQKALCAIASIEIKAEEEGIKEFARKWRLPFLTYSAAELGEVPGEFSVSEFVRSVAGVDNVCERAAVRAASSPASSRGGTLICRKRAKDGVTVALARRKADLNWEL